MTFKEFFYKLTSRYLWGNLIAMALVLVALVLGLFLFLNAYTHHGETVVVPDCAVNAASRDQSPASVGTTCGDCRHRLQCAAFG